MTEKDYRLLKNFVDNEMQGEPILDFCKRVSGEIKNKIFKFKVATIFFLSALFVYIAYCLINQVSVSIIVSIILVSGMEYMRLQFKEYKKVGIDWEDKIKDVEKYEKRGF